MDKDGDNTGNGADADEARAASRKRTAKQLKRARRKLRKLKAKLRSKSSSSAVTRVVQSQRLPILFRDPSDKEHFDVLKFLTQKLPTTMITVRNHMSQDGAVLDIRIVIGAVVREQISIALGAAMHIRPSDFPELWYEQEVAGAHGAPTHTIQKQHPPSWIWDHLDWTRVDKGSGWALLRRLAPDSEGMIGQTAKQREFECTQAIDNWSVKAPSPDDEQCSLTMTITSIWNKYSHDADDTLELATHEATQSLSEAFISKIKRTSRGSDSEQKKRFATALLNELESKFMTVDLCTDALGVKHKYPTFFTLLTGLLAFIQQNVELLNKPKLFGFAPSQGGSSQSKAGQANGKHGGKTELRGSAKKKARYEQWKAAKAAASAGQTATTSQGAPPLSKQGGSQATAPAAQSTFLKQFESELHAIFEQAKTRFSTQNNAGRPNKGAQPGAKCDGCGRDGHLREACIYGLTTNDHGKKHPDFNATGKWLGSKSQRNLQ